ncbi:MAG: glycoside hydrolase family 5 protein, partial [Novosphingobium sp.]|nr:glycoside hydrolase family 5 protein [Novosphingobium sp.]
MLQVKGNKILQDNVECQIKGISLIDIGELAMIGRGFKARIDTAKQFWDINTIRLPVYPPEVIGRRSPFPYSPRNRVIESALAPAAAYAEALDLNIIIDWHQINPLNAQTTDQALAFWREAIPLVKDFDNVIFEIYNEPSNGNGIPIWESTATESWAECKPFLQTLVSGVRELSDNLIICPTPTYCRLPLGANADPIKGENVAYSVHVYPPEV